MQTVINLKNIGREFRVNNCDTIFDYLKGKNFQKKKRIVAVDDISFDIKKGEFVGLLGVNGAGKSTLIKMMTGILVPTRGKVEVFGNDPFKKRTSNNYRIGAVFGQRCQLRWDISPIESYRLFQAIYKIPEKEFTERLKQMVDVLKIEEVIKQPVRTLSLGQKMRAELAGAFLHKPEILFLDEPTLGLDVVSKEAIINFLLLCKKQKDTTIIFTTHDMEDVKQLCERLIIINKGKLFIDDKIENLRSYTELKSVIKFSTEKENIVLPEELVPFQYVKQEQEIRFENVEENQIAYIVEKMFAENNINEVDIKKPEFKDIFMNLFKEELADESGSESV